MGLCPTPEACAAQRTPYPCRTRLAQGLVLQEGYGHQPTPCPNWPQQEPVHYGVVHLIFWCSAEQAGPLWPLWAPCPSHLPGPLGQCMVSTEQVCLLPASPQSGSVHFSGWTVLAWARFSQS